MSQQGKPPTYGNTNELERGIGGLSLRVLVIESVNSFCFAPKLRGEPIMPTQSRFVPLGSEAPDFALPSVSGEEVRLSDYRGQKHVVLVFLRGFF